MKSFNLDIVAPEKIAYSEEVESVSVPSIDGVITILPDHVPIFSALSEGEVVIKQGKENYYLSIGGGFIEVTPSKTSLLVTRAFKAEELNEKSILEAIKDAETAIKNKDLIDEDRKAAQALLRSTLVDLKVYRRRRFHS